MKNAFTIGEICGQIAQTASRIRTMSLAMNSMEDSRDPAIELFSSMRMDELEHIQLLALKLTDIITSEGSAEQNADGSAFFAGELAGKKNETEEQENV